jgi:hypothetical protein
MYIRAVEHENNKNRRKYRTYKLVDSVRTERGPRQTTILNLGSDFSLPKEDWKHLANCIEEIVTEQQSFFEYPPKIKELADKYARRIIQKQSVVITEKRESSPDYATVDLNSLNNEKPRTAGAEHVVYETLKLLKIDKKLVDLGLKLSDRAAIMGVICGRMIAPGSERATHYWLQNISALGEVIDFDFSMVSLDRLYMASDHLLKHKEAIEAHLRKVETEIFDLEEKIILYDLTNTFFEGTGKYNAKAKYGRSKEKRNDCPLVTLGLVLDMQGFPKRSRIYEGNVSEPGTLETMIKGLADKEPFLFKPTVVMDAGIATDKNIEWLKEHNYRYIVVSRKKKTQIPDSVKMVPVKMDEKTKAALVKAGFAYNQETDEMELYCHSVDKEKKEESIKSKFQQRFEAELLKADKALNLKYGTKGYDKVIEKVGRLKEKFKRVSHLYTITIYKDADAKNASRITWKRKKAQKSMGVYCLRTYQQSLDEKEVWDIYTMLTDIEDAFRCMKSELGLRPNYHQIERRCDGHIFITLLAYHIMQTVRTKLRDKGVRFSWETVRTRLSSHERVSTILKREDGKVIHIRKSTKAEPQQREIYAALGLPQTIGKTQKAII